MTSVSRAHPINDINVLTTLIRVVFQVCTHAKRVRAEGLPVEEEMPISLYSMKQ